jgi:hypothetical protein
MADKQLELRLRVGIHRFYPIALARDGGVTPLRVVFHLSKDDTLLPCPTL